MTEYRHQAEIIERNLWTETALDCLVTGEQRIIKCRPEGIYYCPMCGEKLVEDR